MGTQKKTFAKNGNYIKDIHNFIAKEQLIHHGSTVLLGLSGGPDSIFLLHVLVQYQKDTSFKLVAAHLDHEWRDNSAVDAQFCQQTCEKLGVPLISQKMSEIKFDRKFDGSRESSARHIRRYYFESIIQNKAKAHIALAHHAQDQQETFFIRLLRGASLSGLTSMSMQDGLYIRPLLHIHKKDILEYLNTHNIAYLTDPTNKSNTFLRNRIRNHVIPALQKADNRFDNNFAIMLKRLQDTELFLQQLTAKTFKDLIQHKEGASHINLNLNKLFALNRVMQHRVILYWLCTEQVSFVPTESLFNEILRFLKQPGNNIHYVHSTWAINKKKQCAEIIFTP
ncbi:tRNA lysidine(34) synthetase TilS [Candidatus Dependentiae bacterium]|nr:tRNA lysidine(34) synthetase TilS [Candidatus Dependentiae bacterium]